MFACIFIASAMGIVSYHVARMIERWLLFWHGTELGRQRGDIHAEPCRVPRTASSPLPGDQSN